MMGADYPGPEPDPRYWVQCSCGNFKMYGPDLKTVMDWLNLHTKINKDTHFSSGGFNSYVLYAPQSPKRKWWQRAFGKHEGKDL